MCKGSRILVKVSKAPMIYSRIFELLNKKHTCATLHAPSSHYMRLPSHRPIQRFLTTLPCQYLTAFEPGDHSICNVLLGMSFLALPGELFYLQDFTPGLSFLKRLYFFCQEQNIALSSLLSTLQYSSHFPTKSEDKKCICSSRYPHPRGQCWPKVNAH